MVIAAATSAHAELIHQALDAEVPVFCEKPVALDVAGTLDVVKRSDAGSVPVQIGFQRRFDRGYRAAREALRSGDLGWIHTLRACTSDQSPPPAAFIPSSGGLFRDCSIHDFDILRWLTGREIVSVYAQGANRGDPCFTDGDDVDTCAALLRFDDDTLATVTATRYNGAGHDVRLEVCGSKGARIVGSTTGPRCRAPNHTSPGSSPPRTRRSLNVSATRTSPSWAPSWTWPPAARRACVHLPRPWRRCTSPRRATAPAARANR